MEGDAVPDLTELPGEAWVRVLDTWQTATPRAPLWAWLLVGAVAAVAVRSRRVETWVTLLHEAGHAVVALLLGHRLHGLHVHGDGSGLVISSGRGRWRSVMVSAAGYPAPAWAGAALLTALITGRFGAAAVVAAVIALILLPWARSWRALMALAAVVAAVGAFAWWPPSGSVTRMAAVSMGLLALIAVLGAFRDLLGERRARRSGARTDVSDLAAATRLPEAVCWTVLGAFAVAAGLPVAHAAGVLPVGLF
jgi:hypothetical protein